MVLFFKQQGQYFVLVIFLEAILFIVVDNKGTTRYVATFGNDTTNRCSIERVPCKTIEHAVRISTDNDTIALLPGRKNNEDTHEITGNNNRSLVVDKSLNFIGVNGQPRVSSLVSGFTFHIENKERRLSVNFSNIKFDGVLQETRQKIKKCKPSSYGLLFIKWADVQLRNCTFTTMCTNAYAADTLPRLTSMHVSDCLFEKVHYVVFSKSSSLLKLNLFSSVVVGELESDTPHYAISVMVSIAATFHISNCHFRGLNEAVAVSVKDIGWLKLKITRCTFRENAGQSVLLSFSPRANFAKTTARVESSEFTGNDGGFASSVHLVRLFDDEHAPSFPTIHVHNCTFVRNFAQAFFGTIYADGVKLIISDSLFSDNTAGNTASSLQAFGGALFVESQTDVTTVGTSFVNNSCSGFGGAVFSRGTFRAINCEFVGPYSSSETGGVMTPLLGDILYATAGLYLENTTWYPRASYQTKSSIWHPGSPKLEDWLIRIEGYFTAHCPVGHNITGYGMVRHSRMPSDRISMGCRSCRRREYSLQSGFVNVVSHQGVVSSFAKKNASCYGCKYGGICEHGRIKSRSNYYGYKLGEPPQIKFISCPYGYCCHGEECKSYNSCTGTREGRLCGKCVDGLTENLLSANCIETESCNDAWFWFLYFPFGWVYILFFMYLDKISTFFKEQLIWWENKVSLKGEKQEGEKEDGFSSAQEALENHSNSSSDADSQCLNTESDSRQPAKSSHDDSDADSATREDDPCINSAQNHDNETTTCEASTNSGSYSEITNIVFYFYQVMLIVRNHDNIVISRAFAIVKAISTSVFTFSVNAESSLSLCPLPNLTPITKSFINRSLAFYIIGILILMNLVNSCCRFTCSTASMLKKSNHLKTFIDFSTRLRVTSIQIVILAYSTITNMIMNYMNCVQVEDVSVLYMDGSITCLTWWQIGLVVLTIQWLIPFPVALVLAIYNTHQDSISYNEFLTALAAPSCYILYRLCKATCFCAGHGDKEQSTLTHMSNAESVTPSGAHAFVGDSDRDGVTLNASEMKTKIDISTRAEILRRFKTPFATAHEGIGSFQDVLRSNQPGFWPGIMLIRRLIIIMLSTFINNPVTRIYTMLFACLLFLIHNLLCLPYKSSAMNILETVSSATLVLICSMNLFFAYSYVSNIAPEDADSRVSLLFDFVEATILAIVPALLIIVILLALVSKFLVVVFRIAKGVIVHFRCQCNDKSQ
eukprot:gene9681-10668_t